MKFATRRRRGAHQVAIVAATLLAALAGAAPAAAISDSGELQLTLSNQLDRPARLITHGGSECWIDGGLGGDGTVAQPHHDASLVTQKDKGLFSCGLNTGQRGFAFQLDDGHGFTTPDGIGDPLIGYHFHDYGDSRNGFYFENLPSTWLPRSEGHGLLCARVKNDSWYSDRSHSGLGDGAATIELRGDASCNVAGPTEVNPPYTAKSSLAAPVGASADLSNADPSTDQPTADAPPAAEAPGQIVDVLTEAAAACAALRNTTPDRQPCANAANGSAWDIGVMNYDVQNFKVTNDTAAVDNPKELVGEAQISIPPSGKDGSVTVTTGKSRSFANTTTTQTGGKIGGKVTTTAVTKIPFIAEGKVAFEVNGEYNFSSSHTEGPTVTNSTNLNISASAEHGYTTRLTVFTEKRAANYHYEADLTMGKPGTTSSLLQPATSALDMSPSSYQPCPGYIIGDKHVRNSFMAIDASLRAAGVDPTSARTPDWERSFMNSVPGWSVSPQPCPGFPAGFASAAAFKGKGVGTYEQFGYTPDGKPVDRMIGCVFVTPYGQKGNAATDPQAAAGDDPCHSVSPNGGTIPASGAGQVLDQGDTGSDGTLGGSDQSDMILASEGTGQNPETIDAGGGRLDVIDGSRRGETINGEGGVDSIRAGAGADRVSGGPGDDTIDGGRGDDVISDGGGVNHLMGGPGDDRLLGSDMAGSEEGGPGDDTLVASGNDHAPSLQGGPGGDTYVLRGGARPPIFEAPRGGRDIVETTGSLRTPADIEVARAIGARHTTLRAGDGRQTLVAGRGGAVLDGGAGSDRLVGGAGKDELILGDDGFDDASGGAGPDRFVVRGTPVTGRRPAALERPAHRTAHLIRDFHPDHGDRLVLPARSFGSEVLGLKRHFRLVTRPKPRPRHRAATLLLDTRTGLVSFDRDGTGPISDQVVAVLPGARTLRPAWIEFRAPGEHKDNPTSGPR
jgi:Ca2+-binding RTX toxin-like protein